VQVVRDTGRELVQEKFRDMAAIKERWEGPDSPCCVAVL